ncbi:MAG: ferritin family protein [Rubrobacteridae bacterium]|nr:ferritin family protein [Rubrobacteridae bacterium]
METSYCDALRIAFEFEKNGEQFYRELIKKVVDEFAQKVLTFLADEEVEHIRKIETFNDALLGNSEFDLDKECSTNLDEKIRDLVRDRTIKEESKISTSSTDIDVYEVAMDMEKKGHSAYEKALSDSDVSSDERIKRFFLFMIDEEKEHYDLLAASKKYLDDPSYYFLDYGGWVFS